LNARFENGSGSTHETEKIVRLAPGMAQSSKASRAAGLRGGEGFHEGRDAAIRGNKAL
jgi:hypothetical protein